MRESSNCSFLLRCKRGLSVIATIAWFLVLSVVSGQSAEPTAAEPQKAEAPKAPAAAPPAVIPIAEIATRAMEVSNLLGTITAGFASSPEIDAIRKSLPEMRGQIDREVVKSISALQGQPTLATLQMLQQLWQRMQIETTGWLNTLTEQATRLQDGLNRLADLQKNWSSTRAAVQAAKQPGPVLQQINATLAAIAAAQEPLQAQRTAVLELQSRVAHEVERCGAALAQSNRAAQMAVEGIFARDARTLWSAQQWAEALTELPGRVRKISEAFVAELRQYGSDPTRGLPLHMALFIALAFLFRTARQQVRTWKSVNEPVPPALEVFENPYAAALVAPVFIATTTLSQVPAMVRILYLLLAVVPVIVLLRPVITPRLVPMLYMIGLLLAFDAVRQTLIMAPFFEQGLLLLETIGSIGVAVWLLRILPLPGEAAAAIRLRILRPGVVLALFILLAGLSAELASFMRLARLMTNGILTASALVLALYAIVRVLRGMTVLALRGWPLRMLRMVIHHGDLLEQRINRLFVWAAVAVFLVRLLSDLGLLNPALSFVNSIFSARLERGSISISFGDVLAFFLTVWVAYLLSAFIRFVLQEDVYPRMHAAPGMSYATSSLINYIIIALGFIFGIGVMGVNLNRVSVLAGAFGVGIGFGLQSVVNNFVSGLILLFERPVHVGDTIEIGDLQGEVRSIGIRASTVRTWQGADIIVPNAQFITEKVTNWTLRDQLRRIDLPVGVSYGTAPQKVIELLEKVANANYRVLREPPPQGLFTGYGDSSINFELRAWTDQFYNWQNIRSELAVAVYDAVCAAGMTFPFPQRDVHIIQEAKTEKKE
jgi:X-X-X-Leu-X-X-Gly heptad repeat protein